MPTNHFSLVYLSNTRNVTKDTFLSSLRNGLACQNNVVALAVNGLCTILILPSTCLPEGTQYVQFPKSRSCLLQKMLNVCVTEIVGN